MSGLADENDRCVFGAYPGKLKEMLGIWVEETDALRPYEKNRMRLTDNLQLSEKEYDCGFLCDIIHPEGGAEVLASYKEDFYADTPCVTRNFFGKWPRLLYRYPARTAVPGGTGQPYLQRMRPSALIPLIRRSGAVPARIR